MDNTKKKKNQKKDQRAPTAERRPNRTLKKPGKFEIESRRKSTADYLHTKEMLLSSKLLKAAGGQGQDARSPSLVVAKNGVNSQIVKESVPTVFVTAQSSPEAVWYLALAPVSLCIQRGWLQNIDPMTNQPGAQIAYDAWVYLIRTYYDVMNGTFPNLQAAPLWFWETASALFPGNSKFKTGSIEYKWSIDPQDPPIELQYAPSGSYFFGVPSPVSVNDFPILSAVVSYLPSRGTDAIASMFKFMNSKGMAKIVEKPESFLTQDSSAFASSYVEWGGSSTLSGGVATTLQHEVKVCCPLLSKFAQYQPGTGNWRGFQDARKSAGTSSYIIPRSLEFISDREFRNKASPVFKFYNFDEYFLTLSYIMALALERISSDMAISDVPICPLTSWQVQIVLRQAMLDRFCNLYAQDLYLTGGSAGEFVPFCVGPNGNSTEISQSVLLPFVFLENVRSATRRTIAVGASRDYVVDYVPILSRNTNIPQLKNFEYQGRTGTTKLYKEDPAEINVSLIDLSYILSGSKQYITATGDSLTRATTHWNTFIKACGNALSELGTIGCEPGISALITTFNTRHTVETPVLLQGIVGGALTSLPLQKKVSTKSLGSKVPSLKEVGAPIPVPGESDQYLNYSATKITSTDPFYASLWRYTSAFVQPCTYSVLNLSGESTISFQQVFQNEPFAMSYSDLAPSLMTSFSNFVSINSLCYASALLDIKTNLSAPSEAQVELEALAHTGRGGFFTSLAGAIGEGLGIPGAREVANTVGALTGL